MKKFLLCTIAGLFVVTGSAVAEEVLIPQEPIIPQITYHAPLTAQITGPADLVARAQGFEAMPIAGCGYRIDWGDGTTSPQVGEVTPYCSGGLTHSYDVPGEYIVKVTTYDAGPADEPINQQSGEINIHIE